MKYLAGLHKDVVVFAGVRKEKDAEALKAEGLPNLRCKGALHTGVVPTTAA